MSRSNRLGALLVAKDRVSGSPIFLNLEYIVQNSFRSFFINGTILGSLSENVNEFNRDGIFARDRFGPEYTIGIAFA